MGYTFLQDFSNDVILEVSYAAYSIPFYFIYWLGSFAGFCLFLFLVDPNGSHNVLFSALMVEMSCSTVDTGAYFTCGTIVKILGYGIRIRRKRFVDILRRFPPRWDVWYRM